MGIDIAIDLGSTRIRTFMPNKNIVIDEPSIVALDLDTNEIVAIGEQAYKMLGKTSQRIDVFYPIKRGVISDYEFVEEMILQLFHKLHSNKIVMPRAVVCVPSQITELEKKAIINSISVIGVRKIYLIETAIAAAMGAGLNTETSRGHLILNIGGEITEIAIISLNGIVVSKTLKIAGNTFNNDIIQYAKKTYNIVIGEKTAEECKISIGGVAKQDKTFKLKGRDLITGMPKSIDITTNKIRNAIFPSFEIIVSELESILSQIPPELAGDIYLEGITVTGGSAALYGVDIVLKERTNLNVNIPNEPQNCATIGAGLAIKYINALEKKQYGKVNPLSLEY